MTLDFARRSPRQATIRNLEAVPDFVVNLGPRALAGPMNATSASLPPGESKCEAFGVAQEPSQKVRPPRVTAAPVSLECPLDRIVCPGEGPLAAPVGFGRIPLAHIADAVPGADHLPDPALMDLVGRHGGELSTRTTDRFTLQRPDR